MPGDGYDRDRDNIDNNKRGRTFENGCDRVFHDTENGYIQQSRKFKTDSGKTVFDKIREDDGDTGTIEEKSGRVAGDKDVRQLGIVRDILDQNEKHKHILRTVEGETISKECRELIDGLTRDFPDRFTHHIISREIACEIWARGLELELEPVPQLELPGVGEQARTQKERQREIRQLARISERERENPTRSIEAIARNYYESINKAREQGREVGIDQLRFMTETLRGLAKEKAQADREQVTRDREALGLKFIEGREVERFLQLKADDKHRERMLPIDKITQELIERERIEVAKTAKDVQERLLRDREQGRELDLVRTQQEYLALGNTMGKIHGLELEVLQEIARDVPKEKGEDFLRRMELEIKKRDERTMERIDAIGAITRAAEEREARERARELAYREQVRERAERVGIPTDIARMLEVSAFGPPNVIPEPDAGEDARAKNEGRERDRQERERQARFLGRQPGA